MNITDFLCKVRVRRARATGIFVERERVVGLIGRVMEAHESPAVAAAMGELLVLVYKDEPHDSDGSVDGR